MKKILVTGGMGFIGSNFIRYMLEQHPEYQIINLDKLTYAGNPDNLKDLADHPCYTFVKGDIADEAQVNRLMQAEHPQLIINFAAETHVDRSISTPGAFITTDVYGTYVLLEAAKNFGIERFIHISTDEVYGEAGKAPCKEDAPLMPKSPYAASKAGADRLAFSYYATYGMPVVITRCSNNFGPYQYPEKLIPLFLTNAIEDKPLPVYGTGKNTRDWIYVTDHCRAIACLLQAEGVEGEVFNIGTGQEYSILEIADLLLRLLGKPRDLITFVKDRPGHVLRHAVDTEKIRQRCGWQPEVRFEEGLERTVRWYLDNRWWWEKIKTGEYLEYYRRHYGL